VSDDYITIEVRFPKTLLVKLRQAMTVRFMAGSEGHGIIEAFLGRVLENIADGGGSHEFKSGTITTKVLP
jgi:hypothetical protein